ncbi:hypothetical protein GR140_18975 [Pseudomonas putida]|uniref:hypothetical protein n=1 Tax=Pseudomonas putida TaxID=303 RepID=UPI001BB074A0|nr:hypothetical protein [Pseudomonas putida]QUG90749.1 hypothetical protein GR140_18975 [Pseudomonas putida]
MTDNINTSEHVIDPSIEKEIEERRNQALNLNEVEFRENLKSGIIKMGSLIFLSAFLSFILASLYGSPVYKTMDIAFIFFGLALVYTSLYAAKTYYTGNKQREANILHVNEYFDNIEPKQLAELKELEQIFKHINRG